MLRHSDHVSQEFWVQPEQYHMDRTELRGNSQQRDDIIRNSIKLWANQTANNHTNTDANAHCCTYLGTHGTHYYTH